MKITRKTWSNFEKCQLLLGYTLKVPISVMSKKTCRSHTAINKALSRYKIRPIGVFKKGVKVGAPDISYRDFEKLLESCGLNLDSYCMRGSKNVLFTVSDSLRKKFKAYGISSPFPWENGKLPTKVYSNKEIMSARCENKVSMMYLDDTDDQARTLRLKNISRHHWMSPEKLILYAKMRGLNMKIYGDRSKKHYTASDISSILVAVNKEREIDGMSPINVRDITEV